MPDNKPRCAIYCRVAYDSQENPGEAIRQQRQQLQAYALEMGYTCTAVYEDSGQSGLDLDRPGFAKLNADIAAGKVKVVLTKDPSRLWRDTARGSRWFRHMDKLGVTVLCKDTPEMQEGLREQHSATAGLPKHHKKKQRRHTVRTPPPKGR